MIEIIQLSKRFGNKQVLEELSVSFKPGNIIGIVGANGAGKTTLFRSIVGLEKYEGEIIFPTELQHIGYLPTSPEYLSKLLAGEYLTFMAKARNINTFNMQEVNLFDLPLQQYAERFSTGMKKKLGLTALLLQKNDLYILDEPFSGVDFESNYLIKELLNHLRELGKTIILSSHILSSLTESCDEIHFLKEGKLVESVAKSDFDQIDEEVHFTGIKERIARLNL